MLFAAYPSVVVYKSPGDKSKGNAVTHLIWGDWVKELGPRKGIGSRFMRVGRSGGSIEKVFRKSSSWSWISWTSARGTVAWSPLPRGGVSLWMQEKGTTCTVF